MVKKNILRIDSGYNFVLTGLICPLPDYRLCWHLNRVLLLDFTKEEDLTITIPEHHIRQNFSRFIFNEDISVSTFWVLQNKSGGEYLLPDVKQIDYILLIKGNYYKTKIKVIEKRIRAIPDIQTTIALDFTHLKNKERLIF